MFVQGAVSNVVVVNVVHGVDDVIVVVDIVTSGIVHDVHDEVVVVVGTVGISRVAVGRI